jgi:cyclophilin family peptidyl-prolyl cis-trans isomerase
MSESCAAKNESSPKVSFETNYGKIIVQLYPETSRHRDNFIKLVNNGYYDGVLFHRVIADFMIQTGDPESKKALPGTMLGTGDVGYTIPAEIIYPHYYHKRGALAAARQGDDTNPKKASSGCQFYIVQGRLFSETELNKMEKNKQQKLEAKMFQERLKTKDNIVQRYRQERDQVHLEILRDSIVEEVRAKMALDPTYKFTEQQRTDYHTLGGTPHLDGEYTVFGEVIEGLEIVEKISNTKVGKLDRPLENIRIIKAKCIN